MLEAGEQESLQEILNYQNNCILALEFQDLEVCSLSLSLQGARVSTLALFSCLMSVMLAESSGHAASQHLYLCPSHAHGGQG